MGDPRKLKNKYATPIHPWEKFRLDAEKPLMKEYGLVNKKELWRVTSKLKNFKDTVKKLVAAKTTQAEVEKKQMVDKLKSLGLISSDELDDILGLDVRQLLDRRLQTVVFKKGLARSIKQARQMITHRHIAVNGVKITAPSYLVRLSEEESLSFVDHSKFNSDAHPERVQSGVNVEDSKPEVIKANIKSDAEVASEKKSGSEEKSEEKPVKEVAKESDVKEDVKSEADASVVKEDKKEKVDEAAEVKDEKKSVAEDVKEAKNKTEDKN